LLGQKHGSIEGCFCESEKLESDGEWEEMIKASVCNATDLSNGCVAIPAIPALNISY